MKKTNEASIVMVKETATTANMASIIMAIIATFGSLIAFEIIKHPSLKIATAAIAAVSMLHYAYQVRQYGEKRVDELEDELSALQAVNGNIEEAEEIHENLKASYDALTKEYNSLVSEKSELLSKAKQLERYNSILFGENPERTLRKLAIRIANAERKANARIAAAEKAEAEAAIELEQFVQFKGLVGTQNLLNGYKSDDLDSLLAQRAELKKKAYNLQQCCYQNCEGNIAFYDKTPCFVLVEQGSSKRDRRISLIDFNGEIIKSVVAEKFYSYTRNDFASMQSISNIIPGIYWTDNKTALDKATKAHAIIDERLIAVEAKINDSVESVYNAIYQNQ